MRRSGGYAIITEPGAPSQEFDSFTCRHCGGVKLVQARQRAEDLGGLCKTCTGLICPGCVDKGCVPFLKRLELAEARGIALRSYGF